MRLSPLNRDDWFDNLDEENAALLCYDVCKFSIQNLDVAMAMRSSGSRTISIALHDMSFTDVGDYGRLARDIYLASNDAKRPPCAFSVVAERYGESTEDPLVSLVISTQNFQASGDRDGDASPAKNKVVKCIDLKINALSVTVLPRSIDDVLCFLSKKWSCPNANLELNAVSSPSRTFKDDNGSTSPKTDLRFKFVAVYPRVILLADESDPYSRALVLRGLVVGNMGIIREEASNISTYAQIDDTRSTTTLSGHVKELETYVHNNIDVLIGPNRTYSESKAHGIGVALIEPVTVTLELRLVSRTRFPTSRFLSVEIDPVSTLFSFGDLNLIQTVLKKSTRKKKAAVTSDANGAKPENHASPLTSPKVHPLQLSKSSDYSECDEGPLIFEVVILTTKLGLQLRKSGPSAVVECSLTNDKIQPGDGELAG